MRDREFAGLFDAFDEDEENFFPEDEDDEVEDWLRPQWLRGDCADPCMALDFGTCCRYPANPLVRRAAQVADSMVGTLSRAAQGECAAAGAELARLMLCLPGLLAQIHAVLPGASRTTAAQLLCPVERLAGALAQVCAHGCPWACGDPGVPDRRPEFRPFAALLDDCSAALRTFLTSRPRPHRW